MIRVITKAEPETSRTLDEDEFIAEIERQARDGFASAPPGPVAIEALDSDGRVRWQGYYKRFSSLAKVAQELIAEREFARRQAGAG